MDKRLFLCVLGFAGLLTATPVVAQTAPGSPRAEGAILVPAGSTWVNAIRESGSFGAATGERLNRSRGEQVWQGRKLHAYEGQESTILMEIPTARWVARVRGSTPLESWEPALGWQWPIWVGKSWTENFRYTNHQRGGTSSVQGWFKVEAFEDVKVPAGSFKAFRISYSDGSTENVSWWSPENGIVVKSGSAAVAIVTEPSAGVESPPPLTVAVFVSDAAAVAATLTATEIAG